MSTTPVEERRSSGAETAAGFLAAISLTASAIAIFYRPVRLAPFAILVALIASALAKERHRRLAAGGGHRCERCVADRNGVRGSDEQPDLLTKPLPEGVGVVERT